MYKVQFDARVFNPNTEEYITGWIDPARRFEVREEDTDVPTFEFETYEDAFDKVTEFLGEIEEEVDRGTYVLFYAEDSEDNFETGENFTYGAIIEYPAE